MGTQDEWLTGGSMSTHPKQALASFRRVEIDPSVSHLSQVTITDSFPPTNQINFVLNFSIKAGSDE